jgi:prepilin-type N-terminal cleavage/methylation domain-containing protein/prepilin-type processing-associated H-X9-DG protein
MQNRTRRHCGITLIELLVVTAIIGVLMAILIPAVMQARETARRTQCQNNLKQLGIALHNYHGARKSFPAGTDNEWSWNARILPFLEETSLHYRLDFTSEPFEARNRGATHFIVPVLVCPSDGNGDLVYEPSAMPGFRFAHTNYLGSLAARDGLQRGMFGEYFRVRLAEVLDGTSKTLFVGERGVVVAQGQSYGWWVWGPETLVSASHGFQHGLAEDPQSAKHWWSHHTDGAHFLFVDGSVHFLSYSLDPGLFVSLATKDGGEIVSGL